MVALSRFTWNYGPWLQEKRNINSIISSILRPYWWKKRCIVTFVVVQLKYWISRSNDSNVQGLFRLFKRHIQLTLNLLLYVVVSPWLWTFSDYVFFSERRLSSSLETSRTVGSFMSQVRQCSAVLMVKSTSVLWLRFKASSSALSSTNTSQIRKIITANYEIKAHQCCWCPALIRGRRNKLWTRHVVTKLPPISTSSSFEAKLEWIYSRVFDLQYRDFNSRLLQTTDLHTVKAFQQVFL